MIPVESKEMDRKEMRPRRQINPLITQLQRTKYDKQP